MILWSAKADGRSVFDMKKLYSAPSLELLAYCSLSPIGAESDWSDTETDPGINSKPWNDGELGWT